MKSEDCFEGQKEGAKKRGVIDNLDEELAAAVHTQLSLAQAKEHG